jgi:integrase
MPRIKLSQRIVDRLPAPDPSGKQVLHWDEQLPGFGVLCSGVSTAKSYVVQRDLPDGRTRRVTVAACNVLGLDAARRQAEGTLADFYRGIDPKHGRRGTVTLRQTLDDYLAARKGLRANSARLYRWAVERHLAPWADRPLRDITPEMVEARHRAIAAEVSANGKRGTVAANTVMVTLRVLWNFAAERIADLPPNPVRRLRRQWYPVQRRVRMVKPDQLSAFYAAVLALPNPILRDYVILLLFTGARATEAATLEWTDVDFSARTIHIAGTRTKTGQPLDLPMVDVVHDMLVARRALGDAKFVFPSRGAGTHISQGAQHTFGLLTEATGNAVSAHDLRRTYLTVAESTDMSPLALKALVNHSLGRGVTEGYIQMTPDRLREPAQRVADRLKQLCGITPPQGVRKLRRT